MPYIRGCTWYLVPDANGEKCKHPETCERAIAVTSGNPVGLIEKPAYWPALDECNCRITRASVSDEREDFAEQNREQYWELHT